MFEELLLIEPDPEILGAFKRFLELHGFSVTSATCGFEATQKLKLRRPDLIVIEPVLYDDWGERVLQEYRHSAAGVPVIGLSKQRSSPLAFPFCNYLIKPVSLTYLLESIQSGLHSSVLELPELN